jgi:hypothetical protein
MVQILNIAMSIFILHTIRLSRRTVGKLKEVVGAPGGAPGGAPTSKIRPEPVTKTRADAGGDVAVDKAQSPASAVTVTGGNSLMSSPVIKAMMTKVGEDVQRTTRKLEWSSLLVFAEVIFQLLTGTPVFRSGAAALGIITQGLVLVLTLMSAISLSFISDL